jgi:hypothetical protein
VIASDKSAVKTAAVPHPIGRRATAIKKEKNRSICSSRAQGEMSDGAFPLPELALSAHVRGAARPGFQRFRTVCASLVGFMSRIASDISDIVCQKCQTQVADGLSGVPGRCWLAWRSAQTRYLVRLS